MCLFVLLQEDIFDSPGDGVTSDEESDSYYVSSGNDTSFLSVDSGGSVYVPTQKCVIPSIQIPNKLCFVEVHQV